MGKQERVNGGNEKNSKDENGATRRKFYKIKF